MREIHRSPVNFPHKGQWRGALMFSLIYAWINDWVNNHEAGDLRRQHGHYDVIVMSNRCYTYNFLNNLHITPQEICTQFVQQNHGHIPWGKLGFLYEIRNSAQKHFQVVPWNTMVKSVRNFIVHWGTILKNSGCRTIRCNTGPNIHSKQNLFNVPIAVSLHYYGSNKIIRKLV